MKLKSDVFKRIRCNLCDRVFRVVSRFGRICKRCKESDDLYRFSGWLLEKHGS